MPASKRHPLDPYIMPAWDVDDAPVFGYLGSKEEEKPLPPTPRHEPAPAGWASTGEAEAPDPSATIQGWAPHSMADLGLAPFESER